MNCVVIMGMMATNPNIHGEKRCRFGVITLEPKRVKLSDDEWGWNSIQVFHNCLALGRKLKLASKFRKGDIVTIRGQICYRDFKGKSKDPRGSPRWAFIFVKEIYGSPSGRVLAIPDVPDPWDPV